jgi:hypothetical protein
VRQDQFERLQALEEKLLDVFLSEADPDKWPGAGTLPAKMTTQDRGNTYWCRKVAASAAVLRERVVRMIDVQLGVAPAPTPGAPDPGDDEAAEVSQLDAHIDAAEKDAARLMARLQKGGRDAAPR